MKKIIFNPLFEKNPTSAPAQEWLSDWDKIDWLTQHGELAVDVYQTDQEIVIVSAVAGVRPEDLDIAINNDSLTIRGHRHQDKSESGRDYLFKECHWGDFSRTIVLPAEVVSEKIKAALRNGILTITVPKIIREKKIKIEEVEGF